MRKALTLIALFAAPLAAEGGDMRPVTGSLIYRERIALPPEAEMLVELRDEAGAVVGGLSRPTGGAQVPLPFELEGPAATGLLLRGALRVAGEVRWLGGPVEIAAGPEAVDVGEVMLTAFRPMGFASTLSCGELTVELGFVGQGARLRIGGLYLDLVPEETASGARFVAVDDPGTFVWTKGDVATLSLSGTAFPECREALPGQTYRAHGNEPGWRLEITGGQMRYSGDYGATEVFAALPVPDLADGARRYAPAEADLVLTLAPRLCRDDMTGMPHPETATLMTGGALLTGCGGEPADLLTAHDWRVEDIGGGGMIDGSNVTIRFAPGGRVAGSGGCNRYTGDYRLTGEGLRMGPAAATMMACAPALMEQERRFFEALQRIEAFDIAPDGALRLIAGGAAVITARR